MDNPKLIKQSSIYVISGETVVIINHTLKGIKYLFQMQKLLNMSRKMINKYKIQQSPNPLIKVKFKDIHFNELNQSEEDEKMLLNLIQYCYSKKSKNQMNLISKAIKHIEDCISLYSTNEFISQPPNGIIQTNYSFLENFEKFKQLAQNSYQQLLLLYPCQFLIDGLEKFREFFAFKQYLIHDTFSSYMIINQLLFNFLLGIVKQNMLQNGNKLAHSYHIFGQGLYPYSKMVQFNQVVEFQQFNQEEKKFFSLEIRNFICKTFRSPFIKLIIDRQDSKLYDRFFDDYIHQIVCIFIPHSNIKGFTSNKNYIFINIYPVIKEFEISSMDLLKVLKAYFFIIVVTLNQKLNLSEWNAKILPIQQEIIKSECPYFEFYRQIFGIDQGGLCNLKVLNMETSQVLLELYNKYDLRQFQRCIAKAEINNYKYVILNIYQISNFWSLFSDQYLKQQFICFSVMQNSVDRYIAFLDQPYQSTNKEIKNIGQYMNDLMQQGLMNLINLTQAVIRLNRFRQYAQKDEKILMAAVYQRILGEEIQIKAEFGSFQQYEKQLYNQEQFIEPSLFEMHTSRQNNLYIHKFGNMISMTRQILHHLIKNYDSKFHYIEIWRIIKINQQSFRNITQEFKELQSLKNQQEKNNQQQNEEQNKIINSIVDQSQDYMHKLLNQSADEEDQFPFYFHSIQQFYAILCSNANQYFIFNSEFLQGADEYFIIIFEQLRNIIKESKNIHQSKLLLIMQQCSGLVTSIDPQKIQRISAFINGYYIVSKQNFPSIQSTRFITLFNYSQITCLQNYKTGIEAIFKKLNQKSNLLNKQNQKESNDLKTDLNQQKQQIQQLKKVEFQYGVVENLFLNKQNLFNLGQKSISPISSSGQISEKSGANSEELKQLINLKPDIDSLNLKEILRINRKGFRRQLDEIKWGIREYFKLDIIIQTIQRCQYAFETYTQNFLGKCYLFKQNKN
ncbi:hypothetical protein pb186bvf_002570 [Paramecium bursaria]